MGTQKFEIRTLSKASSMDDELALLKIFPAEIWLHVCQSILHNLDLGTKVSDSSSYFQKLLHPLRTKFLFPEVVKCMRKCLPHKMEAHKILQNSRQVCLFWHKTVAFLIREKMLSHYKTDSASNGLGRMYLGGDFCVEFTSEQEVNSFYQHFHSSHLDKNYNPFPAHFLCIKYRATERNYLQALRKLLGLCGHHIKSLTVKVMNFEADMHWLELKHLLDFRPNLKFLTFLPDFHHRRIPRNSTVLPFPSYKNLEFIRVGRYCSGLFVDALLRNNCHVKSLWNIDETLWKERNHWLYTDPMPNLEDLGVMFPLPDELKLLSCPNVNWPLKRLELAQWFSQGSIGTKEMQQCFDVLEQKFAATLTELFLSILILSDPELAHTLRLNLPRLTLVGLTLLHPVALDLILPIKSSLTNLRIGMLHAEYYVQEKNILFFSVASNLLASNIWQLFPKLQQIAYPIDMLTDTAKIYKRTEVPKKPVPSLHTQRNHTTIHIRCNDWSRSIAALAAFHIDHYSGYGLALLLCILGGIAYGIVGHILL